MNLAAWCIQSLHPKLGLNIINYKGGNLLTLKGINNCWNVQVNSKKTELSDLSYLKKNNKLYTLSMYTKFELNTQVREYLAPQNLDQKHHSLEQMN